VLEDGVDDVDVFVVVVVFFGCGDGCEGYHRQHKKEGLEIHFFLLLLGVLWSFI